MSAIAYQRPDRWSVLIVESDQQRLRAAERILRPLGRVDVVPDGSDAFASFERGDVYDVILWEVSRLTPEKVLEKAGARWPHLARRIVFTSEAVMPPGARAESSHRFIHRPFRAGELLRAARDAATTVD